MINPGADVEKLSKLTDSSVIVKLIKETKRKRQQLFSEWLPLASIIFWILFYVGGFFWLPYYSSQK